MLKIASANILALICDVTFCNLEGETVCGYGYDKWQCLVLPPGYCSALTE